MVAFWAKANANFFIGPSHKCDGNNNKMVFSLPLASANGLRL